jgi:hypothetical protein
MHEAKRQSLQAKRAAYEEVWVGPRGQRRYVPRGRMATNPMNNPEGTHPAVVVDLAILGIGGLSGERRLRLMRPNVGDGSRGRPLEILPQGARLLERAAADTEFDARITVQRAITYGRLEVGRRAWGVRLLDGGRVLTIPDKGKPLKWASVEDLVQALATGAI